MRRAPCRPCHVTIVFEVHGLVGRETVVIHPWLGEPLASLTLRAGTFLGSRMTKSAASTFIVRRLFVEQP